MKPIKKLKNYERLGKISILVIFLNFCNLCNFFNCLYCQQSDPEVYFNSGIDKYVKGDYDNAIALFEQTLSENPNHQKAKNFLIKVLIEATEKQIMVSNFSKAKVYIDRAKIIAPDSEKVGELQKVVSGGYIKKEVQKPVITAVVKPLSVKKTDPKKSVDMPPVAAIVSDVSAEYEDKGGWIFILASVIFIVIVFSLVFFWMKNKNIKDAKKLEELKKQIRLEEEKKYRGELEKIKLEGAGIKKELAENIKIQIAEKQAIIKKDADAAQQKLDSSMEEEKILQNNKNENYSKEIIQKMTISIKTIMNVNKEDALNNIKRLSKNENSRLRYDCVKIIENILTPETLKILLDMLDDSDFEVKRAVIMLISNINKLHLPEIPMNMRVNMQKRLSEEKLKNGWII